jgi:hypothetical protein
MTDAPLANLTREFRIAAGGITLGEPIDSP